MYGDISIEIKKEEENESYTVRDLLVTNNRVRRSEEALKSTLGALQRFIKHPSVLSAFPHVLRRTRPERCVSSTSTAGQRWASPPTAKA